MGLGVAVLPRRCALTEIARGHLVAVKVPELSSPRSVRFVFRKSGELSRAAAAFLELAEQDGGDGGTGESQHGLQHGERRNGEDRSEAKVQVVAPCSVPPVLSR